MIFSSQCVRIPVTEASQVGEARRRVSRMAADARFDEVTAGRATLTATELATNLVKYGKSTGELLVQQLSAGPRSGIEMIALDKGPGLSDITHALTDGISTSGSPGTGLGAVRRTCDSFHFYSTAGQGAVFACRLWNGATPDADIWGAVCVPVHGEESCGDRWCVQRLNGRTIVAVVDGLGHGPLAAEAACAGIEVLQENGGRGPAEILDFMHGALRGTRGAAAAVAEIDRSRGVVAYAGVGNIAASIVRAEAARSLISHNGIVGHEVRKIQEFTYPYEPGWTLVMHSDGVSNRALNGYPPLERSNPNVIAAALYRDFARSRDDATVVVVREN